MRVRTTFQPLETEACLNGTPESVRIANLILDRKRSLNPSPPFPLEDFLPLIRNTGGTLAVGDEENPVREIIEMAPGPGEIRFRMDRDHKGLNIQPILVFGETTQEISPADIQVIHETPAWFLHRGMLIELAGHSRLDLFKSFRSTQILSIPEADIPIFADRYLLELARQVPLDGNAVEWDQTTVDPLPRIYLSEQNGELLVQIRFAYQEIEVPYEPDFPRESLRQKPGTLCLVRIIRNAEFEKACNDLLLASSFGLKRAPLPARSGFYRLRARTHPVDFLLNILPRLAKEGFEIFGEEKLKTARVNRNTPTITFHVSSGIDWFDVQAVVNFGELEVSLKDIRRLVRKQERYVKLPDGSIGEIPEEWLERYRHFFAVGDLQEDGLRFARRHLSLIDQALIAADQLEGDLEFSRRRETLRNALSSEFKGISQHRLGKGFIGELRPYQKSGYDWLHFLREYGFGGCLADDMGLGKTIQALAFLESIYRREDGNNLPRAASLLVVPRSLLVNWQREATRFTPNLRILEFFESNRAKDAQVFTNFDLIITTYGVMLRDIQMLHGFEFDYAILDESQSIKNPLSQTARAAHLLRSRNKLVLTGTPIENSTAELWSQFNFLNPGLLGNLKYFKNEFGLPIEKKHEEKAVEKLRRIVYPFILRRTKDQVTPELPPRTERTLYCDMEPAQRKMYERMRDTYRGMLLGMIDKEGLNESRMKILEGLLRLRQISNHPRLVDEKFHGSSGKFEFLIETIETLRAEGHKTLVFSQFVQMLTLVRQKIDEMHIPYNYLDGQTQARQEQVDDFQSDPNIPLFLISLKAGGLGLNLTAADYVIHIDPWWNPAVEMQASDRTHRIGQDKPVFIFKLITRDSVEEKILLLQERKKQLVDQIITTESSFFKEISAEDVRILFG
jgi:non-specific serine/threonine protein kinase